MSMILHNNLMKKLQLGSNPIENQTLTHWMGDEDVNPPAKSVAVVHQYKDF